MLDDFDRKLTERGLRFARYADDCNIYVKSEKAGRRVMEAAVQYLTEKLKLKVNQQKSAMDNPYFFCLMMPPLTGPIILDPG